MSSPSVIHISTPISWRGGEQQLAYTFEQLHNQGIRQMILCPEGSELAEYCESKGWSYTTAPKRSSMDFGFAKKLAKLVKERKFSLVHAHDSHAHTFSILSTLLYGMKMPIVLHRRVDYPVSKSFFSRYKYNHPQIKRIICVSEEVKRVLSKSLKNPHKAVVVHSGIDLDKFEYSSNNPLREEFNIDNDKTLIGNVAAITQQKDYFTFVAAAEKIYATRQDVHFVAIGAGDQKEEIKALVETKGLRPAFTFTGFRKDVNRLLPCLDFLMFSSEKEGLGTTIIDAFATKVAVVATSAGGIPELVTHRETGWLAGVKKPEELAEGVLTLMEDASLKNLLVTNAKIKSETFSKENTAKQILEVYKEIMAN